MFGTKKWLLAKLPESLVYPTTRFSCTSAANTARASNWSNSGKTASADRWICSTWTLVTTTTITRQNITTKMTSIKIPAKDQQVQSPIYHPTPCLIHFRKGSTRSSRQGSRCRWTCFTCCRQVIRPGNCTNRCRWLWTLYRGGRKRRIARVIDPRKTRRMRKETLTVRRHTLHIHLIIAPCCTTMGKTRSRSIFH